MNLQFVLVALLLLAFAALLIEGNGNLKSKEKKDAIKFTLDKKGSKGSKERKAKVEFQKTRSGDSLNVQVHEGGPLLSFKQKYKKPKGSKNCVFSGVDPEDQHNTIVISQCKHFKAGSFVIDGEQFNMNIDRGELDDNVTQVNFTGIDDVLYALPEEDYEKKWDAKLGDWVLEKFDKTKKKAKEPKKGKVNSKIKENSRMQQTTELYVQLGMYIDEPLWKEFIEKYGDKNAAEAVLEFAGYMVQFVEIKYSKGLTYPVRFALSQLYIWKTQPTSINNTYGHSMGKYLGQCKAYINPTALGLDAVIVLSGFRFFSLAGVGFVSTACSDGAVAVANSFWDDRTADVIAHELGHILGMTHGKLHGGCIQGGLGPPFTACSRMQFDAYQTRLDKEKRNCLRDPFVSEPIGLEKYPGQVFPPMQQCQVKGRCYVYMEQLQVKQTNPCKGVMSQVIRFESVVYYTMAWIFNSRGDINHHDSSAAPLFDGAYCGAGKICLDHDCVTLDSGLGALAPVDGGWSPTWATDVQHCKGGCPDKCKMVGQLKLEVEYRLCNNPYPKNGGKYCTGSNSRLKMCGETCTIGASTKEEYIKNICNGRKIGNYNIWAKNKSESCTWVCWPKGGQGFYIMLDNGIECEAGGRCMEYKCAARCPGSVDYYYKLLPSECP